VIAAHNTYLQVAVSFGMLGFIPWLLGLGATGWRLWRQRKDFWAATLLAIFGVLLAGMLTVHYGYGRFAWMFLAVATAAPYPIVNPQVRRRPVTARATGVPAPTRGHPMGYVVTRQA
jgi:O-antigen ligase